MPKLWELMKNWHVKWKKNGTGKPVGGGSYHKNSYLEFGRKAGKQQL